MQDKLGSLYKCGNSLDGTEDAVQFEDSKGHVIIASVTLMIKIPEHSDFILYCHFVE
jgi:hypothetical protein